MNRHVDFSVAKLQGYQLDRHISSGRPVQQDIHLRAHTLDSVLYDELTYRQFSVRVSTHDTERGDIGRLTKLKAYVIYMPAGVLRGV